MTFPTPVNLPLRWLHRTGSVGEQNLQLPSRSVGELSIAYAGVYGRLLQGGE